MKETYFDKLRERLEKLFPKGEHCECGKKLPCRSAAITFNAFANILHNEELEAQKKQIIDWTKIQDKTDCDWVSTEEIRLFIKGL